MRAPGIALGALLLLCAGCHHAPRNPLAQWSPSPNFNARRPQMVIIHHTACNTFDEALKVLQTANSGGPVSSHYLIGRDGRLAQLVSDDHRAWHAGGGGTWGASRDINSLSIGIELDNNGFEPFAQPQIDKLLVLLDDLVRRYDIPRTQIIAHADVDPVRKHDPNAAFPWKLLAEKGFGLWPDAELPEPPADFNPWAALRILGYSLKNPAATLGAFHLHYRATEAGELDGLDRRILFNLQSRQLGTAGLPHQDLGLPGNQVIR
ncbi:N-acetylmuramoyl-L-alanine amidase [Geothrix sp. 21YS21S-2]|uniref:N-acetylmuramoyl-L-alanine amidase n=1 Tax=Geothrix sp. 21YS21S-2 TaxID=3068893 RepID=UPI0027B97B65|nr:N-acetylmuramoyl-L-alanine amidase [Geothrix sp. 21YS21S-2]